MLGMGGEFTFPRPLPFTPHTLASFHGCQGFLGAPWGL